jgi:hypothetical protein
MRNYYYRATICNLPEIPTDNRLALGVKCASCLIKNQKGWIGNQRPSDCQPLLLPTRKVLGILLEQRIEAPRQALYELVGTGQTCGLRPGIRVIAERFGVNPSTVQRIGRPFDGARMA